jgi:hypothetical protein
MDASEAAVAIHVPRYASPPFQLGLRHRFWVGLSEAFNHWTLRTHRELVNERKYEAQRSKAKAEIKQDQGPLHECWLDKPDKHYSDACEGN